MFRGIRQKWFDLQRGKNEISNFIQHPVDVTRQQLQKFLQSLVERLDTSGSSKLGEKVVTERRDIPEFVGSASEGERNTSQGKQPLTTNEKINRIYPRLISLEEVKNKLDEIEEGNSALKGSRWDEYTVEKCIEDDIQKAIEREIINGQEIKLPLYKRIYIGKNRSDEVVLITEYLLPNLCFNEDEIEKRREAFRHLLDLNRKLGDGPDFRIIKLIDAFTCSFEESGKEVIDDVRCYLVTRPVGNPISTESTSIAQNRFNSTLEAYLSDPANKSMSLKDVREVLRQVLETLWFLHESYRVNLGTNQSIKGLAHGNLSLKSLYIRQIGSPGISSDRQFFIYLSNFRLWEHLFDSNSKILTDVVKSSNDEESDEESLERELEKCVGSKKRDLEDLGKTALQLLKRCVNESTSSTQIKTDSEDENLQQFIQRLSGQTNSFRTARDALDALNQFTKPRIESSSQAIGHTRASESTEKAPEDIVEANTNKFLSPTWIGIPLFLMVLVSFTLFATRKSFEHIVGATPLVAFFGFGDFTLYSPKTSLTISYLLEKGIWDYASDRIFISNNLNEQRKNFIDELNIRYPAIKLNPANSSAIQSDRNEILRQVRSAKNYVAFMRLNDDITPPLVSQLVAYDALVVFMPLENSYPSRNITTEISLKELRGIYTGDTLTPTLSNGRTVRLFFPKNESVLDLFRELVLNNERELIQKFDNLERQAEESIVKLQQEKEQIDRVEQSIEQINRVGPPENIYNLMTIYTNDIAEHEEIGIGFDRFGTMFNQCSVYPLAIREEGSDAVSILVDSSGQPVSPGADLCTTKGSFFSNPNIKNYPLKYNLGLVFHEDPPGEVTRLRNALMSIRGQYLLSEIGYIPGQIPLEAIDRVVWGNRNEPSE
ncbi:MAG: hypothetical protein NW224_12440 [Leptolyngbyaceae cyanobacterium bins.302]|nr:hypothetical protein [Leptolyngbyaceae cyanobacterium bins.302]